MSGGVDSSVAILLLQKKGYVVIGATMQIWPDSKEEEKVVNDARNVANKLDIPFYVFDFKNQFKEKVINYFVKEYLDGKTPNPCVVPSSAVTF